MNVNVFPAETWGHDAASRLFAEIEANRSIRICLPTGATPVPMYTSFTERGGDLGLATVFLLDEFGLPPGSAGRCDTMIHDDLLNKLDVQPAVLHTWDTDAADLYKVAADMDAAADDDGLDLMIVGIGGNGHLGLNEPGSGRNAKSRRVDLHPETIAGSEKYGVPTSPTWGMTFGMRTIMAARSVWLIATGSHKASIVASALTGNVTSEVPASFLQDHPSLTVLLDNEAASLM
ncbi:MAG: 6-phosphogluconolactonase [Acidimicrobiia bacterium]